MIATRAGSGRPGRWVVLACLLAFALALLGPAAPRAAARATPVVRVEVAAADVAGTAPAETVTVSGTVTNGSTDALTDVAVHLWRSTAVLRSGDALAAALAATEPPAGRWQPVKTENTAVLASGAQTLAPGETRTFTVSGRLSDLGITSRDASYWVGADVRGRRGPGASASTLGGDRTLITLPGADAAATVVTVVELSATPRVIKPGLFVDEGLTEELNGRLAQLLDAARTRAWVVDPALLDEVRDMADGYRVASENGTQPGAGQAAAQALSLIHIYGAISDYLSSFNQDGTRNPYPAQMKMCIRDSHHLHRRQRHFSIGERARHRRQHHARCVQENR